MSVIEKEVSLAYIRRMVGSDRRYRKSVEAVMVTLSPEPGWDARLTVTTVSKAGIGSKPERVNFYTDYKSRAILLESLMRWQNLHGYRLYIDCPMPSYWNTQNYGSFLRKLEKRFELVVNKRYLPVDYLFDAVRETYYDKDFPAFCFNAVYGICYHLLRHRNIKLPSDWKLPYYNPTYYPFTDNVSSQQLLKLGDRFLKRVRFLYQTRGLD